jgi:hypothetical protein
MLINLRIHFVGLAMFVPEGSTLMHVLLPAAEDLHAVEGQGGAHGAHGSGNDKDKHFARIMYDKAYTVPDKKQFLRTYVLHDFKKRVLELRDISNPRELDASLPVELPALDQVAKPVPKSIVEGMPGDRLTARVTLDAGALTNYTLGARFRLKELNPAERMTIGTEWTIPNVVPQTDPEGRPFLRLVIRGVKEDDPNEIEEKNVDLFPICGAIHLMVFHTVPSEFPPFGPMFNIKKPRPTESAHHFAAYYKLCEPTTGEGPRPEAAEAALVGVEGDIVTPNGAEVPSMTCPQSQGTLG